MRHPLFKGAQLYVLQVIAKCFASASCAPRILLSNSCCNMACRSADSFQRLPLLAKPTNYNITLQPFFDSFTFLGSERIHLDILQPTDKLKFYSTEIDITNASLLHKNQSYKDLPVKYDSHWMTAELQLPTVIGPGPAELILKFTGILNDKLKGFYRSSYVDKTGEKRYLATTQFESTSARRAFPCWDEPVYKATFDVTLIVPASKTALSNMQEIEVKPMDDGWKAIKFGRTPVMSTYLVAFVVGDFDYVETFTDRGIRVRVYTVPGRSELGRFALDFAAKALPFYEKYFGIDYCIPKCDLVAIPDFEMGAMENWGLITYREMRLLFDPNVTSLAIKQDIALVIAHELAHMWFGNLVTMEWWTDLFLKEGFATWMEYFCVNNIFPDFDVWSQFVSHEMATGMKLDALRNSHPIEVPINDPSEVDSIYDAVSYSKSASIIRMLVAYIGSDISKIGLHNYLTKYSYKNAVAEDLWECFGKASGKNVTQICSNWTKLMGYPMVEVSVEEESNKRFLKLHQRRFLEDGAADESKTVWQIPVVIRCEGLEEPIKYLLTGEVGKLELDSRCGEQCWLKVNSERPGFYRVKYDDKLLNKLLEPIRTKQLSAVDRFGIVSDMFAFVRAGMLPTTTFLNLLLNYVDEDDFNVWAEIDNSLVTLRNCLERVDMVDQMNQFVRKMYSKIFDRLGFEKLPDEGHTATMLRPIILRRLGESADARVVDEAKKLFEKFKSGQTIPADVRSAVFALLSRHGGDAAFDELLQIYTTTDSNEIKQDCMQAFGQSGSNAALRRTLDLLLTDDIRLQDLIYVVAGMVRTRHGQDVMWDFFKANSTVLVNKCGSPTSVLFTYVIKLVVRNQCSLEIAKEMEEFFDEHNLNNSAVCRPLQQSLENVRLNAALLSRDAESIKSWFEQN